MMSNLVPMPPRTKKPDPQCEKCRGTGHRHEYYVPPGHLRRNVRVIICECAKVASGEAE